MEEKKLVEQKTEELEGVVLKDDEIKKIEDEIKKLKEERNTKIEKHDKKVNISIVLEIIIFMVFLALTFSTFNVWVSIVYLFYLSSDLFVRAYTAKLHNKKIENLEHEIEKKEEYLSLLKKLRSNSIVDNIDFIKNSDKAIRDLLEIKDKALDEVPIVSIAGFQKALQK